MIFDLTKDYVPESYSNSRDFRVFLKQLSLITTVFKYNIDSYPELYIADKCPDHLLPLLSSMVGFNYDDNKSTENNRKIIKNYPYLLRNRGSELGIKLAMALSLNSSSNIDYTYSIDNVLVSVNVEEGLITIYYPYSVEDYDIKLLEAVRPVGMKFEFVRSDIGTATEEFDLQVTARGIYHNKSYDTSDSNSNAGYDVNI